MCFSPRPLRCCRNCGRKTIPLRLVIANVQVVPLTSDDDHERLYLMHLHDANDHMLKLLKALGDAGWLLGPCATTTMGGFYGTVVKARDGELLRSKMANRSPKSRLFGYSKAQCTSNSMLRYCRSDKSYYRKWLCYSKVDSSTTAGCCCCDDEINVMHEHDVTRKLSTRNVLKRPCGTHPIHRSAEFHFLSKRWVVANQNDPRVRSFLDNHPG
jgi:hypothetical protein